VLLLAGLIPLAAGALRLGGWFRVTAPAVVYGMLAGIGILIVLSQVHVMLDATPNASGLDNLLAFPEAVGNAFSEVGGNGLTAGLIGLGTIVSIWLWERYRPARLRFLLGALIGVSLRGLFVSAQKVAHLARCLTQFSQMDWHKDWDYLGVMRSSCLQHCKLHHASAWTGPGWVGLFCFSGISLVLPNY
jgi:MFS superfamily sulfate permease-like transporter